MPKWLLRLLRRQFSTVRDQSLITDEYEIYRLLDY